MSTSHSSNSTTIKTLFVLGTTTASIASGGLLFTTYMHVPGYLASPSPSSSSSLLTQWQTMGAIGKTLIPPLALFSASTNFLNAYLSTSQPQQRYRFLTAGVLTLAILPYTALSLASTNIELGAREQHHHNINNAPDTGLRHLSVKELIQRWGNRSAVRGFVLLASTLVSYDAMLGLTF